VAQKLKLGSVMKVRRHQATRLESFVDASFAFAVTLIVISVGHVPNSIDDMLLAMRGAPTFAVCFLLISRLWLGHRFWSRHFDIEDHKSTVLGLMLVFVVLLYVYPLRLMFSLMFAGISGGWLAESDVRFGTVQDLRGAYLVFGVGLAAISLIFIALFRHALSKSREIGLDANEIVVTQARTIGWLCTALVATVSVCVALFMDFDAQKPWLYAMPGWVYMLLAFTRPTINAVIRRQLPLRQ
jgi:uncharacterized membrane protein